MQTSVCSLQVCVQLDSVWTPLAATGVCVRLDTGAAASTTAVKVISCLIVSMSVCFWGFFCNTTDSGSVMSSDVDECQFNPCINGRCDNTPGSYKCLCRLGYRLSGNKCTGKHADPEREATAMFKHEHSVYRCTDTGHVGYRYTV